MENENKEIGWDAVISDKDNVRIVLPEGDYPFKVIRMERGRYLGSAKIPACNKVTYTLVVNTNMGESYTNIDLILYSSVEWKLSSFLRCVGLKKHGEDLKLDVNKPVGCFGKAHFKPREYLNKNNETRVVNDVTKFYDYDEKFFKTFDFEKDKSSIIAPDEDLPF